MDSLDEVDEVVHRPTQEFVESTNVWAFMQAHDIADYDELIERTTTDLDWFWGELPDYLGLDFHEEYDQVRDETDGPQFTQWYPGRN